MGKIGSSAPSRARIVGTGIVIDVRVDERKGVGYRVSVKEKSKGGDQDFGPFRELLMRNGEIRCSPQSFFNPGKSYRLDEITEQMISYAIEREEYLVAYSMLLTFIESRLSIEMASAERLSMRYALELSINKIGEIKEGIKSSIVTLENQPVTTKSWTEAMSAME